MATEIVARAAGFDRDDDTQCLTAGFAESPDGSGLALLFQVSTYEPDEQDLLFGWDTYCIVTGDQSGTCYGGLLQAHLVGTELSLLLNPDTASKLGLEANVKVRLDVDECSLREFRDGFRQVVLVRWGRPDQVPTLSGF
jgi:immunity protein 10 of polymorphic toxin system